MEDLDNGGNGILYSDGPEDNNQKTNNNKDSVITEYNLIE